MIFLQLGADNFTRNSAEVFCRNLALDIQAPPQSMRLISYSFGLCPTSSYWIRVKRRFTIFKLRCFNEAIKKYNLLLL